MPIWYDELGYKPSPEPSLDISPEIDAAITEYDSQISSLYGEYQQAYSDLLGISNRRDKRGWWDKISQRITGGLKPHVISIAGKKILEPKVLGGFMSIGGMLQDPFEQQSISDAKKYNAVMAEKLQKMWEVQGAKIQYINSQASAGLIAINDYLGAVDTETKEFNEKLIALGLMAPEDEEGEEGGAGETKDELTEKQQAVINWLQQPYNEPTPVSAAGQTIQEIGKALSTAMMTEAPLGMGEQEIRGIIDELGISEEQSEEIVQMQEYIDKVNEFWTANNALVQDVISGMKDWKMPSMSFGDRLKRFVLAPMVMLGELMQPYYDWVNTPLAGLVTTFWDQAISGELLAAVPWMGGGRYESESTRINEEENKEHNWWYALGETYRRKHDQTNLVGRMAIEIATDPLSYFGFGIVAGVVTDIGTTGPKFLRFLVPLGGKIGTMEKAYFAAIDRPFHGMRSFTGKVSGKVLDVFPTKYHQSFEVARRVKGFTADLFAELEARAGIKLEKMTAVQVRDNVLQLMEIGKRNPTMPTRTGRVATALLEGMPLTGRKILDLVNSLPTKLARLELKDLHGAQVLKVNDIMTSLKLGRTTSREAAKVFLNEFGLGSPSEELMEATVRRLNGRVKADEAALRNILKQDTNLRALVGRRKAVLAAQLENEFWDANVHGGVVSAAMRVADKMESLWWRERINRFMVRPMAEAYLAFQGYGVMNAAEGIIINLTEGILPSKKLLSQFDMQTFGLTIPTDLRGEVHTFPLGKRFGAPGNVSYIPTSGWGQVLGGWSLKLSDWAGSATRKMFVGARMKLYLADMTGDVDFLLDAASQLSRKHSDIVLHDLTAKKLWNETIPWLILTGQESVVKGAKQMFTAINLNTGKALKIVDKYADIPAMARWQLKQDIMAGRLNSPAAIRDHCNIKMVSNAAKETRQFSKAAQRKFEELADAVVAMNLTSHDDIAKSLQTLVAISEASGELPHRIMRHAREVIAYYREIGKYNTAQKVWEEHRAIRSELVDHALECQNRISDKIKLAAKKGEAERLIKWETINFSGFVEKEALAPIKARPYGRGLAGEYNHAKDAYLKRPTPEMELSLNEGARLRDKYRRVDAQGKWIESTDYQKAVAQGIQEAKDEIARGKTAYKVPTSYEEMRQAIVADPGAIPGEPYEKLGDWDDPEAWLTEVDEGKYTITVRDGRLVKNPLTNTELFDNGESAWQAFFNQFISGEYVGPEAQKLIAELKKTVDSLTLQFTSGIKTIKIDAIACDNAPRRPGEFVEAFYNANTGELVFRSAAVVRQPDIIIHELAHDAVMDRFKFGKAVQFFDDYAKASGRTQAYWPAVQERVNTIQEYNSWQNKMKLEYNLDFPPLADPIDKENQIRAAIGWHQHVRMPRGMSSKVARRASYVRASQGIKFMNGKMNEFDDIMRILSMDKVDDATLAQLKLKIRNLAKWDARWKSVATLDAKDKEAIQEMLDAAARWKKGGIKETVGPPLKIASDAYALGEAVLKGDQKAAKEIAARLEAQLEFQNALSSTVNALDEGTQALWYHDCFYTHNSRMEEDFARDFTAFADGSMEKEIAEHAEYGPHQWKSKLLDWFNQEYPKTQRGVLLTDEQYSALEGFLNSNNARMELQREFWQRDRELIDEFMKTPKNMRDETFWNEFWNERESLYAAFDEQDAQAFGMQTLYNYEMARVMKMLPEVKYASINATDRALSPRDIAALWGADTNELYKSFTDVLTASKENHFVEYCMARLKIVDPEGKIFQGFTRDKFQDVYTQIVAQLNMVPKFDLEMQKIIMNAMTMSEELERQFSVRVSKVEEAMMASKLDDLVLDMKNAGLTNADGSANPLLTSARQEALDKALKDYYLTFADYDNVTLLGDIMRHIFPYWGYESYRIFTFMPRSMFRRPQIWTTWGRWNNATDEGYVHIPGTDIELNPARGTVMGVPYRLLRQDYPSYFETWGTASEVVRNFERYGFYPGFHIAAPMALFQMSMRRPTEIGELLPVMASSFLNVLAGSEIPKISDGAKKLQMSIFHDRFRDFMIARRINTMQVRSGGTLIGGQSGVDLWWKMLQGRPLSNEEQKVWDTASTYVARISIGFEQWPLFRMRPTEQAEAFAQVEQIIYEATGITPEQQEELFQRNMKPTDFIPMSPTVQQQINSLWSYRIWLSQGQILSPPSTADVQLRTDEFWKNVDSNRTQRMANLMVLQDQFLGGGNIRITGKQYREARADEYAYYANFYTKLRNSELYKDLPLTSDERAAMYAQGDVAFPPRHPMAEALEWYYTAGMEFHTDDGEVMTQEEYAEIPLGYRPDGEWKVRITTNPETGEAEYDYETVFLLRRAIRESLSDENRAEFDAYTSRFETPIEKVLREANSYYFHAYWSINDIIAESTYGPIERRAIEEFYDPHTSMARKEEIRNITSPHSGRSLIGEFQEMCTNARKALRQISPMLDTYLYVFGYTSTAASDESRAMIDAWEADRMSIL